MTIISATLNANGQHDIESQPRRRTVWLEGYIEVPRHLEGAALTSAGYCDLAVENGVLVGVTPLERPAPTPAMTADEAALDMLSDIDYRIGLLELKEAAI